MIGLKFSTYEGKTKSKQTHKNQIKTNKIQSKTVRKVLKEERDSLKISFRESAFRPHTSNQTWFRTRLIYLAF